MERHNELLRYFVFFGVSVVCTFSGFLIGRYTTAKQVVVNTVVVTPTPAPETDMPEPTSGQLSKIIQYKNQPGWKTYSDKQARFSIQYDTTMKGIFGNRQDLGSYEYGKDVTILECYLPRGANEENKLCKDLYKLEIFNNYENGSRRVWLTRNKPPATACVRYYQDIVVMNKNALIATSNCSSWGETYVMIPDGSEMILVTSNIYSRDDATGLIKLPEYIEKALTTFRYL